MDRMELIAELTKIGIKELAPSNFKDTNEKPGRNGAYGTPSVTVEDWYLKIVTASKKAATEISSGDPLE